MSSDLSVEYLAVSYHMLIYNLENIAKYKFECKIPISNNSLLFKKFIISLVKHFLKRIIHHSEG